MIFLPSGLDPTPAPALPGSAKEDSDVVCLANRSSICAFVYIQPSLIPIPKLPKVFNANRGDLDKRPPHDQYLDAECDMSILFYEIMCYNRSARNRVGDEDDIKQRLALYEKRARWEPPPFGGPSRGQLGFGQAIFLGCAQCLASSILPHTN